MEVETEDQALSGLLHNGEAKNMPVTRLCSTSGTPIKANACS